MPDWTGFSGKSAAVEHRATVMPSRSGLIALFNPSAGPPWTPYFSILLFIFRLGKNMRMPVKRIASIGCESDDRMLFSFCGQVVQFVLALEYYVVIVQRFNFPAEFRGDILVDADPDGYPLGPLGYFSEGGEN